MLLFSFRKESQFVLNTVGIVFQVSAFFNLKSFSVLFDRFLFLSYCYHLVPPDPFVFIVCTFLPHHPAVHTVDYAHLIPFSLISFPVVLSCLVPSFFISYFLCLYTFCSTCYSWLSFLL